MCILTYNSVLTIQSIPKPWCGLVECHLVAGAACTAQGELLCPHSSVNTINLVWARRVHPDGMERQRAWWRALLAQPRVSSCALTRRRSEHVALDCRRAEQGGWKWGAARAVSSATHTGCRTPPPKCQTAPASRTPLPFPHACPHAALPVFGAGHTAKLGAHSSLSPPLLTPHTHRHQLLAGHAVDRAHDLLRGADLVLQGGVQLARQWY